ncbi:MAG: prepilin-type cleavage/methylation domain-containing protein [Planctomyces sp.]|nr:prepilin-type cleavage/methylation domain-containing protein [Planctomyces sp.]
MSLSTTKQKLSRSGFTLVELLVVMAIISVLIGLLLPAVQQARSAARRTQHRNNMKQVGIAIHSYLENHTVFPPGWQGWDSSGGHDIEGGNGMGWAATLLPYIEQQNIYDAFDTSAPVDDPVNELARTRYIPTFRNPLDVGPNTWTLDNEDPGDPNPNLPLELATANYVGVFGTVELHDCESLAPGEQCEGDGIFFHNSNINTADIHDGLTNTYMVGERKTDESQDWFSTWVGNVPLGEEHMARFLGVADHTPNHPDAHFEDFSSWDTDGVFFLYADGHVGFVSENVHEELFQALSTIHGHEPFLAPAD